MSVAAACPQRLPALEGPDATGSSPAPASPGPEENHPPLQMTSAGTPHTDPATQLLSSAGLLIQDSPDSSTSPEVKPLVSVENGGKPEEKVKKQKIRTVFSQDQLCVLHDRFQRQKYLSLQQMQELSSILNLTYKQVKTWFQNQRMKCKKWQRKNLPNNMIQKGCATAEYPGLCSPYQQGCLVNTPENLPVWSSNQTMWGNQTWNNPAWNNPSWSSPSWDSQSWYPQTWNSPLLNCGEEMLQPCVQFSQTCPATEFDSVLETAGESLNTVPPAPKHLGTPQALDLLLSYPVDMQPDDL
ncbi:homeobox protein NANOG [Ochotona princeps]|uniref:homeobox protein NANOG n=1 Tax=Ochotona princeps TaxID=9978 RepID=UPI002714FE64|nr:homeobox protein NANOG [Ochotona princeps]